MLGRQKCKEERNWPTEAFPSPKVPHHPLMQTSGLHSNIVADLGHGDMSFVYISALRQLPEFHLKTSKMPPGCWNPSTALFWCAWITSASGLHSIDHICTAQLNLPDPVCRHGDIRGPILACVGTGPRGPRKSRLMELNETSGRCWRAIMCCCYHRRDRISGSWRAF